jgi:lantibiotic biosynthesis protein
VIAPASSRFLLAALRVARQLVSSVEMTADGPSWQGDQMTGATLADATVVRGVVGADLYGGLSGIAWFLAGVAPHDPSGDCARLAAEAIEAALSQTNLDESDASVSLYGGACGVALAAVEIGARLDRDDMTRRGLAIARQAIDRLLDAPPAAATPHDVDGDGESAPTRDADLIAGLAGVLVAILAIARRTGDRNCVAAASRIGERLLARARRDVGGWSWPEPGASLETPALCGLAHGASGVGWALLELFEATKEAAYRDAAAEAFRYERTWFSHEQCAWADLRGEDDSSASAGGGHSPAWMTAWCHGAIGIGMARLRWYELTGDRSALADASVAIESTRRFVMQAGAQVQGGDVVDASLCHGLAGAAELCLLAHDVLGPPAHLAAARRIGDLMLRMEPVDLATGVWPCGVRGGRDVPGLFLGVAGIGAAFLRLHDPAAIGSPALAGRPAPAAGAGAGYVMRNASGSQ